MFDNRKLLGILAVLLIVVIGVAVYFLQDTDDDSTAETEAAPPPDPVAANADWTPVAQTFDGVEMVLVPPGCFTMGNDEGRRDERPAHEVCFEQPFWIDRYEVTNGQFGSPGAFEGDDLPRGNLTWFDVRDYCQLRGGRLPTEAEWEYAARGPDGLLFPSGEAVDGSIVVTDENTGTVVLAVGSFPANASWVGAYDMIGNMWEWVSSAYERYPYTTEDGREDLNNAELRRVYRGGRSAYQEWGIYTPTRFWMAADGRDWFIGFRCVRNYAP